MLDVFVWGDFPHPSIFYFFGVKMLATICEHYIKDCQLGEGQLCLSWFIPMIVFVPPCAQDPSRPSSGYFELAAWPCTAAASKMAVFEEQASDPRHQRGQWECLHRIGMALEQSKSIKYLVMDRHGSHGWLASWVLGRQIPLSKNLSDSVPFFGRLTFVDLPHTSFPLPYRACFVDGESFHYIPGVAHCQKAFCEQLRSSLGTLLFGKLSADYTGALDLGLFPCAYIGSDTMSDRQAAMMLLGFICGKGMSHHVNAWWF